MTSASQSADMGRPVRLFPLLAVRRGRHAVEFHRAAFGALEIYRVNSTDEHPDVVSQLTVGDESFWVADEAPEYGNFSPETLGGGTVWMILVVDDPVAVADRAISAGATEVRPVQQEYGWLLGRLVDPYGHHWEIGQSLGRR